MDQNPRLLKHIRCSDKPHYPGSVVTVILISEAADKLLKAELPETSMRPASKVALSKNNRLRPAVLILFCLYGNNQFIFNHDYVIKH